MFKEFHSKGKLLITGEYFVLDGALALAMPCKFGQSLVCSPSELPGISWQSLNYKDLLWYEDHFYLDEIFAKPKEVPSTTKETLQKLLYYAAQLNPEHFKNIKANCKSKLEFPNNWGLGSSSTLINNIASWAKIDAFKLLDLGFGGSGYDIAAAQAKTAFLYSNSADSRSQEVELNWDFTDSIFFVHQNKKQDSKLGIQSYQIQKKQKDTEAFIQEINQITKDIIKVKDLASFSELLHQHEEAISSFLEIPRLQTEVFSDYPHLIKSLGAWGGDFFLAVGAQEDQAYFREKGYGTILAYNEMIF